MKVRFAPEARGHLAAIFAYIASQSPLAAEGVLARIRLAAEQLGEFPRMGRAGGVPGTYEWPVKGLPYLIVYELRPTDELIVLGVFHGAQDRDSRS
jgi:toxin ParE1/3/4